MPLFAQIVSYKRFDPISQAEAFALLRKNDKYLENFVSQLADYLEQLGTRMNGPGSLAYGEAEKVAAVLGKLGPKAKKAVPALLNVYKRVNQGLQAAIISAWAEMGPAASDALPVLYQLLASTEKNANSEQVHRLRQMATAAIKAISK